MTRNGGTTYVYDAENRLVWTTGGYRYVYDGDGKRVEKCVAGSATTACPTSGTNGTLYWMGGGSAALDESDLSGTCWNSTCSLAARGWRGGTCPPARYTTISPT